MFYLETYQRCWCDMYVFLKHQFSFDYILSEPAHAYREVGQHVDIRYDSISNNQKFIKSLSTKKSFNSCLELIDNIEKFSNITKIHEKDFKSGSKTVLDFLNVLNDLIVGSLCFAHVARHGKCTTFILSGLIISINKNMTRCAKIGVDALALTPEIGNRTHFLELEDIVELIQFNNNHNHYA